MARKRKTDQSKLGHAATLLKKLEEKTAHAVKPRLSDSWRENLFEILMTRMDLATPHKKDYAAIPSLLRKAPGEIPTFARLFFRTMKNILTLAKAPTSPVHVAAFSILYTSVVETFLNDATEDHSRTMAALDRKLGLFEQAISYVPCN